MSTAVQPTTNIAEDRDPAVLAALQVLYRFSSLALSDPRRVKFERWKDISASQLPMEAAAIVREASGARMAGMGPCEVPPVKLEPALVLAALPADHVAWNQAYEQTFGLLVAGTAPPYETEYISGKLAFQRSQTLADLAGFYQAFGLAIPDEVRERVDHITLELEFMACLSELERAAVGSRDEHAEICRDARRRFFQEHLGWWGVGFAKLLQSSDQPPFYKAAGTFLAALLTAQRAIMGIQPSERVAMPQDPDEIGPCDECLVANL